MDWSAIAAWIALAISVTGTIIGPIITTVLANRHQIRLRQLDMHEQTIKDYEERRFQIITSFLSSSGRCLAYMDTNSLAEFGKSYHSVYQYVPQNLWPQLDEFYMLTVENQIAEARNKFPSISHTLIDLLKESPPTNS
ncbi:hypothetical protein [Blautia marasmi]|uniref:hypothetical protein n=1 Tax=Blautia marasmi TaxID=1917868 RepID=UPI0035110394